MYSCERCSKQYDSNDRYLSHIDRCNRKNNNTTDEYSSDGRSRSRIRVAQSEPEFEYETRRNSKGKKTDFEKTRELYRKNERYKNREDKERRESRNQSSIIQQLKSDRKKLKDEIRKFDRLLKDKIASYKSENKKDKLFFKEQLETLTEERNNLVEELEEEREDKNNIVLKNERDITDIRKKCTKKIAKYKMTVDSIDDINKLKESVSGYIQEISKLKGVNFEYENKIREIEVKLHSYINEKDTYFRNQEQIYTQNQKTIENTHQTINNLNSKLSHNEIQLNDTFQELSKIKIIHHNNIEIVKKDENNKFLKIINEKENKINKEFDEKLKNILQEHSSQIKTILDNNLNSLITLKNTNTEVLSTIKQEISRIQNNNNQYKLDIKNLENIQDKNLQDSREKKLIFEQRLKDKEDLIIINQKNNIKVVTDIKGRYSKDKKNSVNEIQEYKEQIRIYILETNNMKTKQQQINNHSSKQINFLNSQILKNNQSLKVSQESQKSIKSSYELKYTQQNRFLDNLKKQMDSSNLDNEKYNAQLSKEVNNLTTKNRQLKKIVVHKTDIIEEIKHHQENHIILQEKLIELNKVIKELKNDIDIFQSESDKNIETIKKINNRHDIKQNKLIAIEHEFEDSKTYYKNEIINIESVAKQTVKELKKQIFENGKIRNDIELEYGKSKLKSQKNIDELITEKKKLIVKLNEFDNVKISFANSLETLNDKIKKLRVKNTTLENKIEQQNTEYLKQKRDFMSEFNGNMKKYENGYNIRLRDATKDYEDLKHKYDISIKKKFDNKKLEEKLNKNIQELTRVKESCTKQLKEKANEASSAKEELKVSYELSIKKLTVEIELLNLKIKATENNLKDEREFMAIYKKNAEDVIRQQKK